MIANQPSVHSANSAPEDRAGTNRHLPVMVDEVTAFITDSGPIGTLVDGTAGAGGHIAALRKALPDTGILGVDRDPDAVRFLEERFAPDPLVRVWCGSYTRIPALLDELGLGPADAVLFDLGFSSAQLDDPGRGFSHSMEGPLDMRFDRSGEAPSASELVNHLSRRDLADIIYRYGEEGRSRRIADSIVRRRPIFTTGELTAAVCDAVGGRRVKVLSRVFQAIRIAVNGELDQMEELLSGLHSWTAIGCRTAFITFHSLEDRLVKSFFGDSDRFMAETPPWKTAGPDERRRNPRSRSARLRMGLRI